MKKVITYGTFDLIHEGHIRLLQRAKALGDYLVVGVTSDDFDQRRGKINVQQSLMERIEGVKATGIADEIIVEEYEGQKIDDISRMQIDLFVLGSDWVGKFDYIKNYCEVVYLPRTEGISSTQLRDQKNHIRFGLCGEAYFLNKVAKESQYVNGMKLCAVYHRKPGAFEPMDRSVLVCESYEDFLDSVDAFYLCSTPAEHDTAILKALERGKHVVCHSPLAVGSANAKMLFETAKQKNCILQEAIKTAYSAAYYRMLLLIKSGRLGDVVSIDSTCTSMSKETLTDGWSSIEAWGPIALLPVLQILGVHYNKIESSSVYLHSTDEYELLDQIHIYYDKGFASVKIGTGIKSEGELIISGTRGYIYVPAPWWKSEYFEIRYENPADAKKYFYQSDGEGIRNELVSFSQKIIGRKGLTYISREVSYAISDIIEKIRNRENVTRINLN